VGGQVKLITAVTDKEDNGEKQGGKVGEQLKCSKKANEKVGKQKNI
jgi:hypothetical protein